MKCLGGILIVEDDNSLRRSLSGTLQALGYQVWEAATGELAIPHLRTQPVEVVLLDLNMPGIGGAATCLKMRNSHPALQIIVVTVRDRDEDKVATLDAGADDYVTKPFRLPELEARIRSAVRRFRSPTQEHERTLELGEIFLDPVEYRVTKRGQPVRLTPKEFELLHELMKHAGSPIAHHRLLMTVWGNEYGSEREYLRTYVSQLRRKIEDDPTEPKYLLTDNYVGYRFARP